MTLEKGSQGWTVEVEVDLTEVIQCVPSGVQKSGLKFVKHLGHALLEGLLPEYAVRCMSLRFDERAALGKDAVEDGAQGSRNGVIPLQEREMAEVRSRWMEFRYSLAQFN